MLEKQFQFSRTLALFLAWMTEQGFTWTMGDCWRSTDELLCPHCGDGVSYQELLKYNGRTKVLRSKHTDRLAVDLAGMLPLPPVPLHLGWRNRIRLGRDYYVRLDTCDYSVDPHGIGRLVDVSGDLDRVKVRLDGKVIADHARSWARGATVTGLAHVQAAAVLRRQFQAPRAPNADDLSRDLGDYDRAFGLDTEAM